MRVISDTCFKTTAIIEKMKCRTLAFLVPFVALAVATPADRLDTHSLPTAEQLHAMSLAESQTICSNKAKLGFCNVMTKSLCKQDLEDMSLEDMPGPDH